MHIDDAALAAAIGRLDQDQLEKVGLDEALGQVIAAMPDLFSVDGAGVLLLDSLQNLRHVASTDGTAHFLEAVQEAAGHGPCVSSLIDDEVVMVDDIATDRRWPDLSPVLIGNGIRSIMGVPVHIASATVGSINVYHRDPHQWDRSDVTAISAFDRVVERLLTQGVLATRSDRLVEQLEKALEARILIDRAVGMLMGLHDLEAADAFEQIRRAARSGRRPIREVSAEILANKKLL